MSDSLYLIYNNKLPRVLFNAQCFKVLPNGQQYLYTTYIETLPSQILNLLPVQIKYITGYVENSWVDLAYTINVAVT